MRKVCLYLLPFFLSCALSVPIQPYPEDSGFGIPFNDAAENLRENKEQLPLQDRMIPVRSGIVVNGNATIQFFLSGESRPSIVRELDHAIFNTPIELTHPPIRADYTIVSKSDGFVTAYKFQSTSKTWSQARKICAQEGAFLAYPTSTAEEAEFQKIKSLNKVDYIWVGLHDLFEQGDWTSVLGESLRDMSYVNWCANEPNNHASEEHCAQLGRNGMNDISCKQVHPYICKIHVKY